MMSGRKSPCPQGWNFAGQTPPRVRAFLGLITLSRAPKWADSTPGWAALRARSWRLPGGQNLRMEIQQSTTIPHISLDSKWNKEN